MSPLSPEAAEKSTIHYERNIDTCVERMEKGYADLVYARFYPEHAEKMCYIPVIDQEIQVFMHKDHALSAKDIITLEDLRNEILLMFPMVTFPENLTSLCIKHGFMPKFQESVSVLSFINSLKQNAGITLLPPVLMEECDLSELVCRPIELENRQFQIGFYARENWMNVPLLNNAVKSTVEYQSSHCGYGPALESPGTPTRANKRQKKKMESDEQFPRITERQMRIFLHVNGTGSISAAAKMIGISEQAASKNLAALEKELRVELFVRKPRSLMPTAIGSELIPLFTQRLEEIDAWYAFAADKCANTTETIVVALESRSMTITFPAYRQEQIQATVSLIACKGMEECLDLLRNGQADLIYCMSRIELPNFRVIPILHLQPVVLMNKRHALANRKTLSVSDLKAEKIAIFETSDPFHKQLQDICLKYGFEPNTITKSYNDSLLIRMVRGNRCIMVLPPNLLSAISMESLVAIPLNEPGFSFSTNLIIDKSKEPSPAMNQLITLLTEQSEKAQQVT